MNRFVPVFLAIFAIIILCTPRYVQAASVLIDHSQTDITALSEADILNAKSKLHISYGHTSHGSQLTDGMSGLVSFANNHGKGLNLPTDIFAWNHGGSGGALDLDDGTMNGDVGYFPDWRDNTLGYLDDVDPATGRGSGNPDVNVIIWSWCGQVSWLSEQEIIDNYLTPMSILESQYWGVKFVYMTSHLDGTGVDGNLNQRNNQIRQYCRNNNKILYDFNDIECYDPDGLTNYLPLLANDNCDYDSNDDGEQDRNWATEWQAAHTENVDWYDCSCAHSQALNGNQKAYAAWSLWTKIAKIPDTLTWKGPGGGVFNLASNWTSNTVPNGVDSIANLTTYITTSSTVTLDSSVTLGTIKFNSTQPYTIAGSGSITLETSSGSANINVIAGSHSISVPVVMNSDTIVSGPGTLELAGGISGTHSLAVFGTLTASSIRVGSLSNGSGAGASAVPEPSSLALFGMGVIGLFAWIRRRR